MRPSDQEIDFIAVLSDCGIIIPNDQEIGASVDPNLSGALHSSKDIPWIYIVAIITGFVIVLAGLLLTVFLRDTPGNERFGFRVGNSFDAKVSSKFAGTLIALLGVWLCVSGLKTARPSVTYRGANHFDVANQNEIPSPLRSPYRAAKQHSTSDQVAALFNNLKTIGIETASGMKPVTIEFPVTEKRMVSGVLLPSSAAPVLKKEKYGFVELPANSVSGQKPKDSEQLLFVPTFQFQARQLSDSNTSLGGLQEQINEAISEMKGQSAVKVRTDEK